MIQEPYYDVLKNWILAKEGVISYDNTGGITKYGIAQKFHPDVDVQNLTIDGAMAIYSDEYYENIGLQDLSFKLAIFLFDTAVNQGVAIALKLKALCDSDDVDGSLLQMIPMRLWEYALDTTFDEYGAGWVNRVADCINLINKTRV